MVQSILLLTSVLSFLLILYPYIGYVLILRIVSKRLRLDTSKQEATSDGGQFSLLFCAFNEAPVIPEKLENLKKLLDRYPKLEILAFDDGSTDGTANLLSVFDERLRLYRGTGRQGKAHGMKKLASQSSRPYLVFTDANVLLNEAALDRLLSIYSDETIGGVCGSLHYAGADDSSTATVGGAYWKLEELIKDLESATGSVMGADGSIFSIRRHLYPSFPDTVLDDFTVSMSVVFGKLRLVKDPDVIAYEKLVTKRADEFRRKIRIAARAFHTHRYMASQRQHLSSFDRWKYMSHKTLRWFGGYFLILFLASTVALLILEGLGGIAVALLIASVLIGLAGHAGIKFADAFWELVLALVATAIGVAKAARGQVVVTWTPAASRNT